MEVNETNSSYYYSQPSRTAGGKLDKNAFLQILAAQISQQDPLENQDASAFVAQLAQFSTLEQMENLNNAFSGMFFLQAGSLINRNVAVTDANGELVEGTLQKVTLQNGSVEVMVDGKYYALSDLVRLE
jgi:flagellar basal-body rod modification protein FlgD